MLTFTSVALFILTQVPVENARFVSRGTVTPLGPSVALMSGTRGFVVGEVEYQSDIQLPGGDYVAAELALFWKVEQGSVAVVTQLDPQPPGVEWYGQADPCAPRTTRLNSTTGAATARIEIPVFQTGVGHAELFPDLPVGPSTVTFVIGWRGELYVNESGNPSGTLASGQVAVTGAKPQNWVGVDPQVHYGVGSPVLSTFYVEPSAFDSTVRIQAQPATAATPPTQFVLVPAGQSGPFDVTFTVADIAPEVTFELVDASDDVLWVSDPVEFDSILNAVEVGSTPVGTEVDAHPFATCRPAFCHSAATVTQCGGCQLAATTPGITCPSNVALTNDGYCFFSLFNVCAYVDKTKVCTIYNPTGTVVIICGTINLGLFTWTRVKTCCNYASTGTTGSVTIKDCD